MKYVSLLAFVLATSGVSAQDTLSELNKIVYTSQIYYQTLPLDPFSSPEVSIDTLMDKWFATTSMTSVFKNLLLVGVGKHHRLNLSASEVIIGYGEAVRNNYFKVNNTRELHLEYRHRFYSAIPDALPGLYFAPYLLYRNLGFDWQNNQGISVRESLNSVGVGALIGAEYMVHGLGGFGFTTGFGFNNRLERDRLVRYWDYNRGLVLRAGVHFIKVF